MVWGAGSVAAVAAVILRADSARRKPIRLVLVVISKVIDS
jgi:hypothetical protein